MLMYVCGHSSLVTLVFTGPTRTLLGVVLGLWFLDQSASAAESYGFEQLEFFCNALFVVCVCVCKCVCVSSPCRNHLVHFFRLSSFWTFCPGFGFRGVDLSV